MAINFEMCATTAPKVPEAPFDFRLDPVDLPALGRMGVRFASLANNHSGDAGAAGLAQTRAALEARGVAMSTEAPTILEGATFVAGFLEEPADLRSTVASAPAPVVASLHFLGNFCPDGPPPEIVARARACAEAGARFVHCHGAHHVLGLERHAGALIFYGLGGLLDDFGSHLGNLRLCQREAPLIIPPFLRLPPGLEAPELYRHPVYRNDLGAIAVVDLTDGSAWLAPTRMEKGTVELADGADVDWVADRIRALTPGLRLHRQDLGLRVELP